jgi:hypothetical protein
MVDPATTTAITKAVSAIDPAVTQFAKDVTGAPGNALGGWIADHIGYLRWKSGIKTLERAARFAKERGIDLKTVPLKNFVPILEGSSLEEEDDDAMIDRWAGLLTNSSSDSEADVPPSFASILKELSSTEARVLDAIYEHAATNHPQNQWWLHGIGFETLGKAAGISTAEARFACETLFRFRFVQPVHIGIGGPRFALSNGAGTSTDAIGLGDYGYAFVNACRAPDDRITPPDPPPRANTTVGTSGLDGRDT